MDFSFSKDRVCKNETNGSGFDDQTENIEVVMSRSLLKPFGN